MSNSISKDGNYKLEAGSLYIRRKARNNVLYWEPVYKTMANNVNDAIDDYTDYLFSEEE